MRILIDIQPLYSDQENNLKFYITQWINRVIQYSDEDRFYALRRKNNEWQYTPLSRSVELESRLSQELISLLKKNETQIHVMNYFSMIQDSAIERWKDEKPYKTNQVSPFLFSQIENKQSKMAKKLISAFAQIAFNAPPLILSIAGIKNKQRTKLYRFAEKNGINETQLILLSHLDHGFLSIRSMKMKWPES